MPLSDKIGTKAEELGGKAKAALKDGVEKVKDAVGGVVGSVAKHLEK